MYLICHVTSQDHLNLEAMQTYWWKLLTVYQLLDKSCDHRRRDRGDMFSIVR